MTDRAMTDTRRVSDTDHGVLVFSPPAKGGKLSEPAEELEDQLSICLAKFAPVSVLAHLRCSTPPARLRTSGSQSLLAYVPVQRAKLVYGAVPCGKAKTYPVEVVIPAAKNVSPQPAQELARDPQQPSYLQARCLSSPVQARTRACLTMQASEVTLVVQAQYQRGKEPPIISCATAGTDIVDGTVTLPESQVSYRAVHSTARSAPDCLT